MDKKINIDILPRKYYQGREVIDWEKSVGYTLEVIYGDIDTKIKIERYNKQNRKVVILWNDIQKEMYTGHIADCKFGSLFGTYNSEYRFQMGDRIQKDNLDIIITGQYYDKEHHHRNYKFKCNICGFDANSICYKNGIIVDYYIDEYNIDKIKNCPCCVNQIVQPGINDIVTTNIWMLDYFEDKEMATKLSYGSTIKINAICPCCNNTIKDTPVHRIYANKKITCKKCGNSASYPERFMIALLSKSKVVKNYKTQYSPNWCKFPFGNNIRKGIYDNKFVVDGKKYIVETDGYFHFFDNIMNGQSAEESKLIDENKDRLAMEHGYDVIRINCFPSTIKKITEEIEKSGLLEIIKLKNVDFDEIDKEAQSSKIIDICNYYMEHNVKSIQEIADIFHIGYSTAQRYLSVGNKHGWCVYPKQHSVLQYDLTNVFIEKYISPLDAEKHTGIKKGNIQTCCAGRQKTAGGYIWRYADEDNVIQDSTDIG